MKEIVYREYGSPDVLSLEDVPAPAPGNDEVLLKIHATSLNSYDQDLLRGWPLTARMWGFRRPRNNILGTDIAGQVEAVGREVTQLQIGDEVFGEISKNTSQSAGVDLPSTRVFVRKTCCSNQPI